jgi:hypothetical protein
MALLQSTSMLPGNAVQRDVPLPEPAAERRLKKPEGQGRGRRVLGIPLRRSVMAGGSWNSACTMVISGGLAARIGARTVASAQSGTRRDQARALTAADGK